MGVKTISPYGARSKKFSKIFSLRVFDLHEFAQQLYETNVSNKCMKQLYDFAQINSGFSPQSLGLLTERTPANRRGLAEGSER